MTLAPKRRTIGLLGMLVVLLAGCQTPDALPTLAAIAIAPPTPPVVVPSPTLAAPTAPAVAPVPAASPTIEATIPPTIATNPTVPTPLTTPDASLPCTPAPLLPCSPASPPPCSAPGRIEHGALTTALTFEPIPYRVYLPPCFGQDGRVYPALYLFGGNIHSDAVWDELGLDEAADAAIRAGRVPPLLIVMVDGGWLANNTTSGPASYEGFILNELIPHVEATYCAWPAREGRAVGGISRGGYWSLMMAFRRPDLFRSVGGHSPALVDSFAGPAEDPRVTGVVNDLGDLRIWLDQGERDPYLAYTRALHDALAAGGVAHEWRVAPGQHDAAYWQANLGDYLAWYVAGFPSSRTEVPGC